MRKLYPVALVLAAAFAVAGVAEPARAASPGKGSPRHSHNLLGESVGLVGYDPVSYFPEGGGKAEKGLIGISHEYDGVIYRFGSEEHRALFIRNPEKFVPVYGGWCAWAVGELGKRVDADPESFEIKNGKLYVFYRDRNLDTHALWLQKPDELISKADANWPALAR